MNHEDLKGRRDPLKLGTTARRIKLAPEGSKPAELPKEPDIAGYIDITPTWRAVLPIMVAGIENGTVQGRKIALEELYRMADAADRWNAHCKASTTEAEGPTNG